MIARMIAPGDQHRWTLPVLVALAATAALARDVPAAAALWIVVAMAGVAAYLLARPAAWVVWFIALGLLAPPLPFELGGIDLPFHPAMALLAAGGLLAILRLGEWRIDNGPIWRGSLMLLGATFISLPWAFYYSGSTIGAQSVMRWFLMAGGFLLLFWIAYGPLPDGWNGSNLLRLIMAASVLCAAFAIVDFQYQLPRSVRFSDQYIYGSSNPIRRAQGVFYDASALGNFCAMILTFILALGRDARRALRLPAWLLWMPVPFLAVSLVVSFSRGSIAGLVVAVAMLAWMRRKTLAAGRSLVALLVLVIVVSVAAVVVAPDFVTPYLSRLEYSASEFFSNPNEVLSKRLETWTELGNFIGDHPEAALLGIGYKSLPYTGYFGHPVVGDNMYLSLLLESGVPGLLGLGAFCLAVLVVSLRMSRHDNEAVAGLGRFLFAFWCGEMVQMLTGDVLTFWRVTPVYLAVLGIGLRLTR